MIELTDKSSLEETNFLKKSRIFGKIEKLQRIFTRKKLKKALNIWKKRFTIPLQNHCQNQSQRKKAKADEIQIRIKFLSLALKKICLLRKKEAFFQVFLMKETHQYESIIKNIVPLTNIFSLLNLKIKQNVINSFEKIKNFSSKTLIFPIKNRNPFKKITKVLEKIAQNKLRSVFSRILLYNYDKLKGYEDFKENIRKEFSKISKKFEKISKLQKKHQIHEKPPSKNPINTNPSLNSAIFSLSTVFIKISLKNTCFSWNKLIFHCEFQKRSSFDGKNSILRVQNRINGAIKHLSRSEEAVSLFSSKTCFTASKETPRKNNKENSQIYNFAYNNEELVSAINFLNNL